MRFDPSDPQHPEADRFILSKGHAAPLLYAAWAATGAFARDDVMNLRKMSSDLEGHPTPRLPFVDVATGSLGQGLCAGIGCALNARRIGSDYRTYVLLGDGESAEGAVWEAAQAAAFHNLDNLCAITDVNALGQSRRTQWEHDVDAFVARWSAFGWHAVAIDGHDIGALLSALGQARETKGKPTMIVARTLKGKGVSFVEDKDNFHGKPIAKGEPLDRAMKELQAQYILGSAGAAPPIRSPTRRHDEGALPDFVARLPVPAYTKGDMVATREAYGAALVALGAMDARVVALDSDVKNSTFSEHFETEFPERFYQMFIAEQVMVGAAMGLAARGAIPFPSSFACFLGRASDFVRMAGISDSNIKMAGSHAGISIGEDGPSQMALEDLAMMRAVPNCSVFYPCDAVSAQRLMALAAATHGPVYLRTTRPKTPVIYDASEVFAVGGSKTLRQSEADVATVVAAGITVFEALEAAEQLAADGIAIRVIDAYSVQPIDRAGLAVAARATGGKVVTVEDHYAAGGLGDAVAEALGDLGVRVRRLAVREIPRSGPSSDLLDRYGISARAIIEAVTALSS